MEFWFIEMLLHALCRVKANAGAQASWGCPKCRTGYLLTEVPSEYRCFCGKQKDPPADPWLAPHTCGDICGKDLASGCDHTCLLLCHPGPCPPCPRQVPGTHPSCMNHESKREKLIMLRACIGACTPSLSVCAPKSFHVVVPKQQVLLTC